MAIWRVRSPVLDFLNGLQPKIAAQISKKVYLLISIRFPPIVKSLGGITNTIG